MLNDPMDQVSRRTPALPESLRQAVREAEATGRAAEERAQSAMPFRARLRARDAVRPQPTLSILTHSAPITAGPVSHYAVSEVRALEKPRVPGRPASKAPLIPVAATAGGIPVIQKGGSGGDDGDDDETRGGFFSRLGDFSQFAFAGLAVLGLAGLSVMAAENALGKKPASDDADGDLTLTTASVETAPLTANVSAAAVEQASTPVDAAPTPWFDYRGTADLLRTRVAEIESAEREANRQAALDADKSAAAAIANAEAARVAAQAPAATDGPAVIDSRLRDRLATEEAMRTADADAAMKLKLEQQAAAAKAEADRLAAEEAARAAAAAAERQRLADAEVARAAEAEKARLADLAAKQKAAEAEAKRLADAEAAKAAQAAEAKRLADIEARRKADAEAKRLADLAAKQKAADAEAKRLADAETKRLAAVEAKRVADAEAARLAAATVAVAAAPAPRVWTNPPGRASLKPVRPAAPVEMAAIDSSGLGEPVVRAAPPSLSATTPSVRAFGPRPVDDFIAERAEYTAGHSLDVAALDALKSDFLRLVESSADGTHHELTTPDGRPLLIHFERTVPVDPVTASIHAISYNPLADGSITRTYAEPANVNVKVMCRDVAYAFPGQERGRFAACESEAGVWTMARASTTNGKQI
jgi:HD-GYP domain-containing protein (c-di-GMP phosphodiesterase class II)